jgi:hypothetical protein
MLLRPFSQTEDVMNRQFALMMMVILLALPATAARKRSVAPVVSDALTIVFVDAPAADGSFTTAGGEAWLDVKDIAHHGDPHQHVTRVQRRFGIRVDRTSASASGTATIMAHLESYDGRPSMRLDGKPLTEAMTLVDAHAPIGTVVFHTLEIEISDSVAPGPIAAAIAWEVTAQ